MNLATEAQMIEMLGCTPEQFHDYLEANVFAPCIRNKGRGRPSKNPNQGAVYDADSVKKEVADFEMGRFTPHDSANVSPASANDSDKKATCGVPEESAGAVLRLDGKGPKKPKEPDFDYAGIIGELKTRKQVRAKILEIAPNPKVPFTVKKDLRSLYKMMCEEVDRKEARKKKVTLERHEADLQKLHGTWVCAWSGEIGFNAVQQLIEMLEERIGKSLRKEHSNIVQLAHRCLVEVSNKSVQPEVIKLLEGL